MKAKIKRLLVNPETFLRILQEKTAWKVSKGVPSTARLRGFTIDPLTQNLNIFIEDSSFEEVEVEKEVAPILETLFEKIR